MSTKTTALSAIANFVKAIGPSQQLLPVTVGGVTEMFWFRRVPYIVMDEIRLSGFGEDGKWSTDKFKGQSARVLAQTLINEDGTPVASYDDICLWDGPIVEALAKVSDTINKFTGEAAAAVGKESGKTQDAASS